MQTGTFKFRGALNRVLLLPSEAKARGVVAFSSGNFGQGLAAAATLCGVKSTIVMPGDAPLNKQARARSYGATVVLSDILEGSYAKGAARAAACGGGGARGGSLKVVSSCTNLLRDVCR